MSLDLDEARPEYSPYAQLVAALLPRAAGLTIFSPEGELRWTSDETLTPQLSNQVARSAALAVLNEEPGERVQLGGNEPAYLFWLRGEDRRPTAVLCIRWRHAENDPRTFSYVHAMLRPVIECLKRELLLQERLATLGAGAPAGKGPDADADNADLRVLISAFEATADAGGDVAQLLNSVNSHMKCDFTALMMPERNLVFVAKPQSREVDTSVLAKAHRHLMSLAQLGKEALLLNEPGSLPGVKMSQRVLVSAVRTPAGKVSALLAMFRSREAPEFRRRDGLLADLLLRRAANFIESRYDALTGLHTRQAFEPRVNALMRERKGPWSFLYLDADRLHAINDNHGRPVGDRLLVKLGELIRTRLAPGGAAARMAGDRFAILLPVAEPDALAFAEGLRSAVAGLSAASLGLSEDAGVHSSLSVGVAPVATRTGGDAVGADDPMSALAAAEVACNAAKRQGRNRVESFESAGGATTLVAEIDAMLATAEAETARATLDAGRLSLHAQLIAPLPGNAKPTPHFELLLRVQDEQGEPIGPGRFLAEAKRQQLMGAVDRWVVRETLALLKPRAALLAGGAVVLTINLSGQSLGEDGFAAELLHSIRGSGVDPAALCFEFNEAAVIEFPEGTEALMRALRELGCHIALDDFGTGASSLASLRTLPLTMLKIDGCFVRDVLSDTRAAGMVEAIAQLARAAGLATVAECVETDEVRQKLAELGVDYGQGYAIARPVPFSEAIRDLPTWASVARQRNGGDVELGEEDDTISAALQKELARALLAQGVAPEAVDDELQQVIQHLMEDAGTGAEPRRVPVPEADEPRADEDDAEYSRQAAS